MAEPPGRAKNGPPPASPPPVVPDQRREGERATTARPLIRAMESADLPFVVQEHGAHFPEGFFVRLGRRFLSEYYRTFLTSLHARAYLAEVDGQRVGYLVGLTQPPAHRRHVMQRHRPALIRRGLLGLLGNPSLAWVFARTRARLYAGKLVRGRRLPTAAGAAAGMAATAVLTHVAVAADAQSRGIGSALISKFEAEVAATGCRRLVLVTASGDAGAGGYYQRAGWLALGEHCTRDGVRLTTYERRIERPGVPGREPTDKGSS